MSSEQDACYYRGVADADHVKFISHHVEREAKIDELAPDLVGTPRRLRVETHWLGQCSGMAPEEVRRVADLVGGDSRVAMRRRA